MQSTLVTVIVAIVTLTLSACVTKNSVLFVTKTSIGVDLDTKPANASIAYDRIEGYVGPRYDNGAIPPVLASIDSDAKIFNPTIRQVYATGDAAHKIVVNNASSDNAAKSLTGDKELMFFGTTTTTGLKVGFTSNLPDSILFGYKRKEFSFIPLGRDNNNADVYPSVLASIDTGATAGSQKETMLRTKQFFATGSVAEALGTKDYIQEDFKEKAQDAFTAYRREVTAQNREALMVLRCFTSVAEADLPEIWSDAHRLGLFHEDNLLGELTGRYNKAIERSRDDPKRSEELRELRGLYAEQIGISIGSSPTRAALIRAHRKRVCPGLPERTTP